MARSTSFRISDHARQLLADRAEREGVSVTSLLDRLIVEGVKQREHPGIIFRGPSHDRRASLAAGPDVWEVVGRLQELEGSEEHRIAILSEEVDLHPRLIRIAVDYAVEHTTEIQQMIDRNNEMAERSRRAAARREVLLT